MPADLTAQVTAQVLEAITDLTITADDYGAAVGFQVFQQGNQAGIGWQILVSLRSPLLGQPPIAALGAVLTPSVPTKPQIREAVTKALAELQTTSAKLLKVGNGHAPTLPGGVR